MTATPNHPPRHPARVGDRDRDEAADRLSAHAAAGRLSVDELEERLERVHGAVFAGDLVAVESDLPAPFQPPRRPHGRRRTAIAFLLAAVVTTAVVGHPVAPLFLVGAVLWRARRRARRLPLSLERSTR